MSFTVGARFQSGTREVRVQGLYLTPVNWVSYSLISNVKYCFKCESY